MNAVDKYYRTKHELLQEGSYAVKIFCDASLKDGVLVSAIYIDDHIRIHTKTKYQRMKYSERRSLCDQDGIGSYSQTFL